MLGEMFSIVNASTGKSIEEVFLEELKAFPLASLVFVKEICSVLGASDIRILDIGCGTSTASAYFVQNILPLYYKLWGATEVEEERDVELWLLDKNRSWLEILEDDILVEIPEQQYPTALVHGDLLNLEEVQLTNSLLDLPPRAADFIPGQFSLKQFAPFPLLLLHSDMLGWLPFFSTDPAEAALKIGELASEDSRLLVTALRDQPMRPLDPVADSWEPTSLLTMNVLANGKVQIRILGGECSELKFKFPSIEFVHEEATEEEIIEAYTRDIDSEFKVVSFRPRG